MTSGARDELERRAAELETSAEAAYVDGDPEGSVSASEELYAMHTAAGDDLGAARVAV